MSRKYIDCRDVPSESNCDLAMSGSEEHILQAAVTHAVTAHGHQDTPELREQLRTALKDETPTALA
jgi:predicted small metal-binding protein